MRILASGTGYLSAHDPRLWFGLGSSSRVESIHVRWPSGLEQSFSEIPADSILDLREGDPEPKPRKPGIHAEPR